MRAADTYVVQQDDFFTGPADRPAWPSAQAPPVGTLPPVPDPPESQRWAWLMGAVGLVAVLGLIVVILVRSLGGGGGASAGNVAFARTAGHATGMELPVPVTAQECRGELANFARIDTSAAKSAFVSACLSAHGTANYNPLRDLTGR